MAINGQTVLAVIPARGGSKRVPMKNLREYRGKKLIHWAMEQAGQSKYIDRFVVSTDDEEIAQLVGFHNDNLIMRPKELATDSASSEDAIRDVFRIVLVKPDWVVLLQPTSPLRTAEDIDACIERAQMGNGCISVGPEGFPNGAVYVATAEWIAQHDFNHLGLMKYRMPAERSLDIDEEKDFAA